MSFPGPPHGPPPLGPDTRKDWASGKIRHERTPGVGLMLLWAILAGWWLTFLGTLVAWAMVLSGRWTSRGLAQLARLPYWAFPNLPGLRFLDEIDNAIVSFEDNRNEQIHSGLRVAYAVVVGWWLSLLALLVAWVVMMTLYGIPASQRLQAQAPRLATLAKY